MTVTREDILKGNARETAHLNYGRDGYGYAFQSVEYPRIGFIDRGYKGKAAEKAGTRSKRIWTLDGVEVASLDAAVAGLATPPALSETEAGILVAISEQWSEAKDVREALINGLIGGGEDEPAARAVVFSALHTLKAKGLIETKLEPREGGPAMISMLRRRPT